MDFKALMGKWPSIVEVGRDLGVSQFTAAAWYRRNSIPSSYWELLLQRAAERDIRLTALDLVRMAAKDAA